MGVVPSQCPRLAKRQSRLKFLMGDLGFNKWAGDCCLSRFRLEAKYLTGLKITQRCFAKLRQSKQMTMKNVASILCILNYIH